MPCLPLLLAELLCEAFFVNLRVLTRLILFWPFIKRRWDNLRRYGLPANLDVQRRTNFRERWWDIRQCDVLFQKRRRTSAGDVADCTAGIVQDLIVVARNAATSHFKAGQSPCQRFSLRFLQCGASDEVRLLHFAEAIEAGFPDVDGV